MQSKIPGRRLLVSLFRSEKKKICKLPSIYIWTIFGESMSQIWGEFKEVTLLKHAER